MSRATGGEDAGRMRCTERCTHASAGPGGQGSTRLSAAGENSLSCTATACCEFTDVVQENRTLQRIELRGVRGDLCQEWI